MRSRGSHEYIREMTMFKIGDIIRAKGKGPRPDQHVTHIRKINYGSGQLIKTDLEPEWVGAGLYEPSGGEPYLIAMQTIYTKHYNPKYGDNRLCECGHPYYRHFDTYGNMLHVGCKYCDCDEFAEAA